MLSKVSLLDSLDSTVGSNKPGASKDREREMNTIHEVDSHNQGKDSVCLYSTSIIQSPYSIKFLFLKYSCSNNFLKNNSDAFKRYF